MNNAIIKRCAPYTAYSPRLNTDVLFQMPVGSFDYRGYFDETAKLVQDEYLCNADTWRMFVDQFKYEGDGKTLAWRIEYWGKMMRGAVFTYEYTRDEKLYASLVETVEDMLTAQKPTGSFTTYNIECEFDGWDLWGRKYVLLGFQYFLDICKDEELKERIIKAMCRHADYIMQFVGREEDGKKLITKCSRNWLGLNSASILEPYVRLYNITGEKKYFDYASYIVETGGVSEGNVFEMAYEDKIDPYEYTTNKAYEMMSCFEGLLEYYRVTGVEKYKQAVVNFAKRVINSDITIIGCSGCTHELFDHSSVNQLNTEYGGVMQETCVTVTWMKYCYQILSITGDPAFADQIELSAYNAMMGAVNSYKIKDISFGFPFDSYSPLLYNTRARLNGGYQVMKDGPYGCCACIGAVGTGIIPLSSAMLSKDGVYINLYIPGIITTETPEGKTLTIKVDTDYPRNGSVKFTVEGADGENFKIAFRIPEFSKKSFVLVNGGEAVKAETGYFVVERCWNNADTVELTLDVRVRTYRHEGVDENSKYHVALYKGPVVLARDARLGEQIDIPVDVAENEEGYVKEEISNTASFPVNMEYKIPMKDGSYITVIDYASAGKTWTKESVMTAWMATKNYWDCDLTKPVKMYCRNSHIQNLLFVGENGQLEGKPNSETFEKFTLEALGDDYYRIRTEAGKYLTNKGTSSDAPATFEDYIDCDCQIWKLEKFIQNRYFIYSKKFGALLYKDQTYLSKTYRLFDVKNDDKSKFAYPKTVNCNFGVAAVFEFKNV